MDTKRHSSIAAAWALALGAVAALAGCSLALDWDPNGQLCDAKGKCLDGYTCVAGAGNGSSCVADHSLSVGDTCVTDVQCGDATVCSGPAVVGWACRKSCTSYFRTDTCDADSYCRPSHDPTSASGVPRGSCVKSECTTDADCQKDLKLGSVCVRIAATVGACLFPCKDPSGTTGIPSCTGVSNIWDAGSTQYCQPLGTSVRLVCLQQSATPQGAAATCGDKVTSATCNGLAGLLCKEGQCRQYCNTGTKQPCTSGCTVVATTDNPPRSFGVCP